MRRRWRNGYTEALRIVTDYSIALSMGYALDKDCCIEYAEALRIVLQRAEQEVTECES